MKKILMLGNLTKDNLAELEDALLGTGLVYTIDLENQVVAIEGDNDALYRARVAITSNGFIIK